MKWQNNLRVLLQGNRDIRDAAHACGLGGGGLAQYAPRGNQGTFGEMYL